jgi:hypothetical protein
MLKKLSLFIVALAATLQVSAADVNLATAQNAARSFLTKQVANGRLNAAATNNLKLVKAEPSVFNPKAVDYYIFNTDKSYVVVAGDDEAPEILMYGASSSLDLDNIPPAMQWLLNKYKYQIDGIKAGTLQATSNAKATTATTPIAPLVTATWDQTAPYYNHTPTSGSTHTYTGCPATSLSMCFYKYKWPTTYPALPKVSVSGGVTAPALSEKAADWDNIVDHYGTWYDDNGSSHYASYTSAQADAVAWLMRYVGQACNMQYSTSGSGAPDPEILEACHTMGYTDAQLLTLYDLVYQGWSYTNGTAHYTDAQWNNYMMTELQAGRPIEYLACDITNGDVAGHAFNVFGCDSSGKYYVNWGWSGDSNGYCTLHNFTTSTGATGQSGSYVFKYGEAMIIGIAPPAGALGPSITASESALNMTANVGQTTTSTFTVTGNSLTGNLNLSVSGTGFSVSTTTISASEAAAGKTVTVTYAPTTAGTHNGTITLSSSGADNVTVALTGTAKYALDAPTLNDASNVTETGFTASWTHEAPVNVTYTLSLMRNGNDVSGYPKTGITGKSVNITGLTSGSTYQFKVKAVPVNASQATESAWSTTKNVKISASTAPAITATPTALAFGNVQAGQTTTKTFNVTGANLTGNITATLNDPNGVYAIDATSITTTQGTASKTITVTFEPKANTQYDATITLKSANAPDVVVTLSGNGYFLAPEMQPANETYININRFRAEWTDQTPADNVASYTLEVSYVAPEPEVQLLNSIAGTDFTGSASGYYDITLSAPWGGTNVRGGLNSIIYFRNNYQGSGTAGNITYTIPEGYDNKTFTMKITTANTSDGAGNLTVATPQTAAVGHTFSTNETFAWLVTASSGEKITITTTDNNYSPDISKIEVYSGDATALTLKANETGDETYRLVTGITNKYYDVTNLIDEGTYTYKVKAIYANGAESDWSNQEQVTLFQNAQGMPGDANDDGKVDVNDVTTVINYILSKNPTPFNYNNANVNGDSTVDVMDVTLIINIILGTN